jgi:hypothetical protein
MNMIRAQIRIKFKFNPQHIEVMLVGDLPPPPPPHIIQLLSFHVTVNQREQNTNDELNSQDFVNSSDCQCKFRPETVNKN